MLSLFREFSWIDALKNNLMETRNLLKLDELKFKNVKTIPFPYNIQNVIE